MISQVKSLYDKYEVDMEMWDYRIEPYLSYAGLHYIVAVEESVSFIPFRFSEHFATEICPKARGRES